MEQRRKTKVYGPYQDGTTWRVIVVTESGRSARRCETEQDAHRLIEELETELVLEGPVTIHHALDLYERRLKAKGRRPSGIATTMQRLRSLLRLVQGRLCGYGAAEAARDYATLVSRVATDTHRNALAEAKTFGSWCIKQGWIRRNPWAEVEATGTRRRGKMQLRVDEARRFLAQAQELAVAGDDSAVAALCCLLLGLRASEVVQLVARDIDEGGLLLHVARAKTRAGERAVAVPELLQVAIARLARRARIQHHGDRAGRGFGRLWPDRDRHWVGYHVRRICGLAGVPVVCPHGLRGTHASLAMAAGASSQLVASSLGHASPEVTLAHYAKPEAVASGQADKAWRVLAAQVMAADIRALAWEKPGKKDEGPTGGNR